jgi:hypothetical protein
MIVVYYDTKTGEHISLEEVMKVEETISEDEILVTYFERTKFQTRKKCHKVLEKNAVTSINVKY